MSNADLGFGLLNMTNFKITVGLSMGATHYYENDVLPGQIFYRWPGAVWYTLYCCPTTDQTRMTDGKAAREIITVAGSSIAAAISGLALLSGVLSPAAIALAPLTTLGGATGLVITSGIQAALAAATTFYSAEGALKSALQSAFEHSNLYAEKKGCYGGGKGTWLILKGGPRIIPLKDGQAKIEPRDFSLEAHPRQYLFERGTLTDYSYPKYHTKKGLPQAANTIGIDYSQPF
jgi:hypothetical protein